MRSDISCVIDSWSVHIRSLSPLLCFLFVFYCLLLLVNSNCITSCKMLSKIIPTAALLAGQAAASIYYAGVAESGGEFGVYSRPL